MRKNHQNSEFGKNLTDEQALSGAEPVLGEPAQGKNSSVDGNNQASAGDFNYSPKKVDGKGSSVKQEVIAKAIAGDGASSSSGGFTPYGRGMRSVPYSGTDARIIDNASGTPSFNKSDRSDSRYGQKNDNTARHINYVPSETYLIESDGPAPLSESADKVQGALGHPANEFALIQKCSEGFPGALNFERSVDEITDDVVIYTEGQQVTYDTTGESYDNIDPTKTYDADTGEVTEYTIHRGNYIPRTVHIKYDESGVLTDYYYDEDSSPVTVSGDIQTERANTHTVTAANRAEIDRQAMALKAGNEVDAKWSPIPYAYNEPTRDVLYATTVEKQLAAQVFVPVKMSAKAHSYALNKASKDGLRPVSAGAEIALGPVYVKSQSSAYDKFNFNNDRDAKSVFNAQYTKKGAPSAIIKMMDSIAKYHDRGDILTQPRSFNMILKQALSNYKPFRIDPEFARVFDNINVFSTIDRSYDPSAPTCIMDSIGLSNPYSFNELGSCFRRAKISQILETNLNDSASGAMVALYGNKVRSVKIGNDKLLATAPIFFDLDSDEHIEDVVITDEIMDMAAKKARRYAVKTCGHELFDNSFVVPLLRKETATVAKEDHVVLLCFNFNDLELPETVHPSLTFYYTVGTEAATESATANNQEYGIGFRNIYNDYLAMYYHNRQNYYYVELRDPYTDGIKKWLRMNAGLILKATDDRTIDWPVHYSTKSFSAYSYLVMLSLKFIQEQRAKALIDVLNYEANFGYPFSDTDQLDNYQALGGVQYGQSDIFEPLEVRQMTPTIALRWTHPELYAKLDAEVDHYRTLLPFYVNEDSYDFSSEEVDHVLNNKLSLNYERASISYPVTKHGVRWSYNDDIYGVSERDLRLIIDQIIAPPSFKGKDSELSTDDFEVYKYSQSNDGLLIIPSDITVKDLLCTARELGYLSPVAGGYLFPEPNMSNLDLDNDDVMTLDDRNTILTSIVGHSSFRAISWVIETGTPACTILTKGSSVIARAANFSQKYYIFNTNEDNPGQAVGLCLATDNIMNESAAGGISNISSFKPFTDGKFTNNGQTVLSSKSALFTYAKGLWARLQKLPFAYNPFDFGGKVTTDPYSFNYLFGFIGFRASDYKEDLYNRLTKRMSDGWKYISDPFVEDSLLIK